MFFLIFTISKNIVQIGRAILTSIYFIFSIHELPNTKNFPLIYNKKQYTTITIKAIDNLRFSDYFPHI